MEFKANNNSPARSKRNLIIIAIIVVALVLLALGGMFAKNNLFGAEREIKGDKYQAVFLTNGQVYFCKLSQVDQDYAKCRDIYYLQVQQSVQPADKKDQPQVSLSKLGAELHGPEDAMYIAGDQILFWENLKDDGKVAQAIKEHQKK